MEAHLSVDFAVRWQARLTCSWTYGQNRTDDEPMTRIPLLMGMIALQYASASAAWIEFYSRMAGSQRRLSARDLDDTRIDNDGTPGWITLNMRGSRSFKHISFNINLENIFDVAYKEHGSGIYSPGRSLILSAAYHFH